MIDKFKDISFYLIIGFVINAVSEWLDSSFFSDYLEKNLITLLIALLAINTTTMSVLMTKLKEIVNSTGGNFINTVDQLRKSRFEQIMYIILTATVLVLAGSPKILTLYSSMKFILHTLLASIFVASMHTLFDTANAIFVILNFEHKK